jgi:hypothetical protein
MYKENVTNNSQFEIHGNVSRIDCQPTPGGISPYNTVEMHSYELGNHSKQDFSPMINNGTNGDKLIKPEIKKSEIRSKLYEIKQK